VKKFGDTGGYHDRCTTIVQSHENRQSHADPWLLGREIWRSSSFFAVTGNRQGNLDAALVEGLWALNARQ